MEARKKKNNNLNKYRERLSENNEKLVRKVIAHIRGLSGAVTFSSVSKVSYELADVENGQKGLTVAGVSKNPVYRALIEEAKANQDLHYISPRSMPKKLSDGDIRLMLHALRVENENLKRDNKILTLKLKELPSPIETVSPIRDSIIQKSNFLQDIARSMTNRLCELELAYIDSGTNTLKVSHYNDVLVNREALEIYYKKELNEIQSKVRESFTEG